MLVVINGTASRPTTRWRNTGTSEANRRKGVAVRAGRSFISQELSLPTTFIYATNMSEVTKEDVKRILEHYRGGSVTIDEHRPAHVGSFE